jgi:hypothetical protein
LAERQPGRRKALRARRWDGGLRWLGPTWDGTGGERYAGEMEVYGLSSHARAVSDTLQKKPSMHVIIVS